MPVTGRRQPTPGVVEEPTCDPPGDRVAVARHSRGRQGVIAGLVGAGRTLTPTLASHCLGRLVGGRELSEALVADALLCAAMAIGLAASEAEATIGGGLRAGMAVPRRASESPARRPTGNPEHG